MKPSTTPLKLSPVSNAPKTKKTNKDREKRKSQNLSDTNSQSSENSSPCKDTSFCKFAGLGMESLMVYNEQSTFEHLSEEVCNGLTEDLNYKLRQIIHEALIKARLSGRNYINSEDIDDVFECLNIEKVYGAPTVPNWMTFGDNNLMYLDDSKINLIQISEEECTAVQPGDTIMERKWLSGPLNVTEIQKKYYTTFCYAVIDKRSQVRQRALKDIKENAKIGPFCEWFYRFGYSLLSKDITYNCLTLYALDLIEALESNPVAPQTVSDIQVELLARLILQRLIQPTAMEEILKPMCRVLAILCHRLPLYQLVKWKLKQKFHRIKTDFALQILLIVNTFGIDTLTEIFLPNIDYFLNRVDLQNEPELTSEILASYNILSCENENTKEINSLFFEVFGESLMQYWRFSENNVKDYEKVEVKWLNVKKQLLKTRRAVKPVTTAAKKRRYTFMEVFPEKEEEVKREIFEFEVRDVVRTDDSDQYFKPKINFRFCTFIPDVGRARLLKAARPFGGNRSSEQKLIVGRIHLLTPILKKTTRTFQCQKCFNHSISQYVL